MEKLITVNHYKTILGQLICLMFGLLSSKIVFANNAGPAGGGGALVYENPNGEIKTLPESGVRIKENVSVPRTDNKACSRPLQYYTVSEETLEQFRDIQKKIKNIIPSFKIPGEIIPEKKKILNLLKFDPSLDNRVKEEYRLVLRAYGYNLDNDKAIVPAYTDEAGITYIFCDFEKLSPVQKAKILIHEAQMRLHSKITRLERLEYALKIDTLVEQIAFSQKNEKLNVFEILKRLGKLKLISQQDVLEQIILMISKELSEDIPLQSLIEIRPSRLIEYNFNRIYKRLLNIDSIQFDPNFIQEFQIKYNLKLNYAEMLEGTIIKPLPETEKPYWRIEPGTSNSQAEKIYRLNCNRKNYDEDKITVDPKLEIKLCTTDVLIRYDLKLIKAGSFISEIVDN